VTAPQAAKAPVKNEIIGVDISFFFKKRKQKLCLLHPLLLNHTVNKKNTL
jgi:hypothetical protein